MQGVEFRSFGATQFAEVVPKRGPFLGPHNWSSFTKTQWGGSKSGFFLLHVLSTMRPATVVSAGQLVFTTHWLIVGWQLCQAPPSVSQCLSFYISRGFFLPKGRSDARPSGGSVRHLAYLAFHCIGEVWVGHTSLWETITEIHWPLSWSCVWHSARCAAAREWIELNSIYVPTTEQVWVTAGQVVNW